MKYRAATPPTPWREERSSSLTRFDTDPHYAEVFSRGSWPENGFLDDFICHTYGYETTNLFAIWTAIAGISGIVQRDAYLNTGKGLFSNFTRFW